MKKLICIFCLLLCISGCVYYRQSIEVPIVSLNMNSYESIHGSGFFLGWSIDSDHNKTYYFYEEIDKHTYQLSSCDAEKTKVIETNEEKPKFKYVHRCFSETELIQNSEKFMKIETSVRNLKATTPFDEIVDSDFVLIVPIGTIFKEFKVSSKD